MTQETTTPPPSERRPPGLAQNPLSWIGGVFAILGFGTTLFLSLLDASSKRSNPYLGIFAYAVFPAVLVFGLALVAAGMFRERGRRRGLAGSQLPEYPRIDFNSRRQRRVAGLALAVGVMVIPISAVTSYRAYEVTESVAFCGDACHTTMGPEKRAHENSAHARVRCVECHVGPGAESYVKAKFSGVRRMYAAMTNTYKRPIPPPVYTLRSATETCGECHWNEKFFGSVLKTFTHFGYDEGNSQRQIDLLMKVGGGNRENGLASGIHWHMNVANELQYISTDEKHQAIPWVSHKDADGRLTIYTVKEGGLSQVQVAVAEKRHMDCMDCHNRAAHTFNPPDRIMNIALLTGRVDPSLPFVKQQGVGALSGKYATTEEALARIESTLDSFYKRGYAQVYAAKRTSIQAAVREIQRLFSQNFSPHMNANWEAYPENVGHYYSPGCFRCHDGRHFSSDGRVIRKDCDLCHTTARQEEKAFVLGVGARGAAFAHPLDLGDLKDATCTDCHTGTGIPQ